MAEPTANEAGFLGWSIGIIASITKAIMADGTIKAAGRQGIDELGQALKAFPDAIQVHETGTIFSPTQSQIASDRKHHLSTPSQIADSKPPQRTVHDSTHEQDHGPSPDHDHDR